MGVIGFMCGILALATAGHASRQVALLRQELDALRAELRGGRPSTGESGTAPEDGA